MSKGRPRSAHASPKDLENPSTRLGAIARDKVTSSRCNDVKVEGPEREDGYVRVFMCGTNDISGWWWD